MGRQWGRVRTPTLAWWKVPSPAGAKCPLGEPPCRRFDPPGRDRGGWWDSRIPVLVRVTSRRLFFTRFGGNVLTRSILAVQRDHVKGNAIKFSRMGRGIRDRLGSGCLLRDGEFR